MDIGGNVVFNKTKDADCIYCKFGYVLTNGNDCICDKLGIIERKNKCSKFIYEPLKRIPSPPVKPDQYNLNDFNIE